MNSSVQIEWRETNRRYLASMFEEIRKALQCRLDGSEVQVRMSPAGGALEVICDTFSLSEFEKGILLLCAGMELEGDFAGLCGDINGNEKQAYPTFGLAMSTLGDPHWSALTPDASLRRWRLIEVGESDTLTQSPLRIDEFVLHYLMGLPQMDARLRRFVEPVQADHQLVPSHEKLVASIAYTLENATESTEKLPIIQLCGEASTETSAIAYAVCSSLGLELVMMPEYLIPTDRVEREQVIRLWTREATLNRKVLLIDGREIDKTDPIRHGALLHLLEQTAGILFFSCRDRMPVWQRQMAVFEVSKPKSTEQQTLWREFLEEHSVKVNGGLGRLLSQFDMGASSIRSAWISALGNIANHDPEVVLWEACRIQSRQGMDDLSRRIKTNRSWDDLILPRAQLKILHNAAAHVRHRQKVYEEWGFGSKLSRGLGISALFAGGSGTGKTMAAEVLAKELRLDLYRIDLSAVVSKYIGETEKQLRRVFDAAEVGGAILLFDEADALFGKRSEVKDSHDRHANIQVSYLLQRMEEYRGLAILTTNAKDALDPAFLRRIRFVVDFPNPDMVQRECIWKCIFPAETPTEGIDPTRLSQLNVAGGNIRNIALNAAFFAAEANRAVSMEHLLQATHQEYAKIERTLTGAEIEGWTDKRVQT